VWELLGRKGADKNVRAPPFGVLRMLGFTGEGDLRILRGMAGAIPSVTMLGAADREFLLDLARQAIIRSLQGTEIEPVCTSPALLTARACFVTLTAGGVLRGCVGNLTAEAPLFEAVIHNATGAARQDPRFPPVERVEVARLRIEISVLGDPVELTARTPDEILNALVPEMHGVVLRVDGNTGTFLPQVWQHFPDRREFLRQLSLKAGVGADGWESPEAVLAIYTADSFEEGEGERGWEARID
jgi:AmmeMemoRadiSam system protein A